MTHFDQHQCCSRACSHTIVLPRIVEPVPLPIDQDDPSPAAHFARDIAPDLDVVLITHYPDVETLDTLASEIQSFTSE